MRKLIRFFRLLPAVLVSAPLLGAGLNDPGLPMLAADAPLTIFVAKKIITMEESQPEASAVAVADGRIVAVGSLASLAPWKAGRDVTVDRQFEDKILLPGFIDPHVHPSLPAILTQFPFLAPDDWKLPTGVFPGARTPGEYREKLAVQVATHFADESRDPDIPFISWGYHNLWHGEVYRQDLNEMFGDQPVMLWQRSFHELIGNDAALALLGVREEDVEGNPEVNWERGHFWENGMFVLVPRLSFLFTPARYGGGLKNFFAMAHESGVTSLMDMGVGIFGDPEGEAALIKQVAAAEQPPTRLVLTPIITDFLARGLTPQQALEQVSHWEDSDSHRVKFDRHFKLMMDGAIYSGASQFGYPGYLDGHQGQWMAPPEITYQWAEVFWKAGYQLHAHTNGDGSAAALLEIVSRLQEKYPRVDHRFTIEHFAYATEDQVRRMHAQGMTVSANPYYGYMLADIYADKWLGPDRARSMVPLGTAERLGMSVALHSDSPMAPLSPLTLVWAAVNRTTIGGNQNFESQALSVEQAMRAVTIDAAWTMRWEDRVGSIRAGKNADFVVLEQNPFTVAPRKIKDIPVWGTVFEGEVHPVSKAR